MSNWFTRLWKDAPAPAQAAAPAAPKPELAATAAGLPATAPPFVTVRALVGPKGELAAFEYAVRDEALSRTAARGEAAAAAQASALVAAARLGAAPGRRALLGLDSPWLARPGVLREAAPQLMVAWRGAPPEAEVAAAWRARGVQLGAPEGPPEVAPQADFVWLRASGSGVDTLLRTAQRWRQAKPGIVCVATGLASIDDVEQALQRGFALVGGRFEAGGAAPARPLDAAAHRVCSLMNHLELDHDTALVADEVRADVALTYRLLRYANSPVVGLTRPVETVEQALMVLGRQELQRWLAVLLLAAAQGRPAAAALQEHTLARGRLLELLARARGEPRPQALFTLGLLSQLDLLLQLPLARALEPLRLSEPARAALLERRGPWAPYLEVAARLDGEDDAALAAAATPFGGTDAVFDAAASSWAWAGQAVASLRLG